MSMRHQNGVGGRLEAADNKRNGKLLALLSGAGVCGLRSKIAHETSAIYLRLICGDPDHVIAPAANPEWAVVRFDQRLGTRQDERLQAETQIVAFPPRVFTALSILTD